MKGQKESLAQWVFALPALFLMGLVDLFPIGQCFWFSRDFQKLFHDGRFWISLKNTCIFTFFSVSLELILGLCMALILVHSFRFRGLVRAAILVPWALPTAVMAMGWRWIFNADYGVLGDLLYRLHIVHTPHIPWLASPEHAMAACIFADVWKMTPFVVVLLMSGLSNIPMELYEAASMDGAGAWLRFRFVTLPWLKPTITLAIIFRAIQAFGIFDLIWVLTGGGPGGRTRMIALYVYDSVFRYQDLGYGCTLTLVMAACLLIMASVVSWTLREKKT